MDKHSKYSAISDEFIHQIDVPSPDHASIITRGDKTIISIVKHIAPGVTQEFGVTLEPQVRVVPKDFLNKIKKVTS